MSDLYNETLRSRGIESGRSVDPRFIKLLYEANGVALGVTRLSNTTPGWSDLMSVAHNPLLVFPYTAQLVDYQGRGSTVVSPNEILFYPPCQQYRRRVMYEGDTGIAWWKRRASIWQHRSVILRCDSLNWPQTSARAHFIWPEFSGLRLDIRCMSIGCNFAFKRCLRGYRPRTHLRNWQWNTDLPHRVTSAPCFTKRFPDHHPRFDQNGVTSSTNPDAEQRRFGSPVVESKPKSLTPRVAWNP